MQSGKGGGGGGGGGGKLGKATNVFYIYMGDISVMVIRRGRGDWVEVRAL